MKITITPFLFVAALCLSLFQLCLSVSLGPREDVFSAYQSQDFPPSRKRIERDGDVQPGNWRLVESVIKGANVRTLNQDRPQKRRRESVSRPKRPPPFLSDPSSWSWAPGNVSVWPPSSASHVKDGYQSDFTGFHGVQGEILGPSFDSSHQFSEWLSMRPVVQCDDDVMTFTASGQESTHLFVDREGASPISLFQLPPDCGYSVRTSWSDLEMMMPYDACYITKQNGSYVLPMLWWGNPMKLSCPVQPAPAPSSPVSAPSVLCSSYAMAVQVYGLEQAVQLLGVMVNGGWGPFVSEDCAYLDESRPEELIFFIPFSAACVTTGDSIQLHLVFDDKEYILTCPDSPQTPSVPSAPSFPTTPPASPAGTLPPQSPTQKQIPQYPINPFFQYPQIPQVYPPGPQPAVPSSPLPAVPLGRSPINSSTSTSWSLARCLTFLQDLLHIPGLYNPYVFYNYPSMTPAPTSAPTPSTTTVLPANQPVRLPGRPYHPQSYFQICSHYPFPYVSLYPPYYLPPYPGSPFSQTSLTTERTLTTTTATTTTTPTPAQLPPQMPSVQCLTGWMVVFLPFAHPDSIQVRDQMKTWLFLSSVSPLCGYMIQMAEGSGVILHSPLPACHSQSRTPTTIYLPLRFWDLSMAQYRTVEPQCPYDGTPKLPAPPNQPVSPSPPSTTKVKLSPSILPKPLVSCSSHQMIVELPPGPISGIVVKDIKGNQMNVQHAPEHCGYSASTGQDGRIRLSLQLHSRCHMSVQGKMYIITVVYMTVNGMREAQLSCPVVLPGAGKECNLPSAQRLPCGPGSVSQPQCLSMGCCFTNHPPACYYPMDECTIDRHFVFSVPASLTEPPLSPSMLVTAGNSTCKPQRVTADYALFKIPMDGCGTRRVSLGQAVIYMVEVINKVQAISLNYGTITRDSPIRLLVECRFLPGTVLTVGYLVKTPTLGPGVQTQGVFGVQLRIAKDAQYSSYYPQYHQPLQMLLGKPLYLEVRLLNAPDPSLVLLVHYCVAYPRSATAVWVLLYNGCPNPLDPALQLAVLPHTSSPRGQTRRFTISTFQFLPDGEFMDPDEEIYFMCSTEICSPRDGPCLEGCFGQ
ncbi:hypothetical protein Q5P01_025134 [Channa striata]|uniref:Uncharacterized protein n=1 Tax=Channa striata TaxID=64152 RepID=A0AA88LNZ3_CHASR|nr:hypothetical protein Q5P01_025134 [Channa striata]